MAKPEPHNFTKARVPPLSSTVKPISIVVPLEEPGHEAPSSPFPTSPSFRRLNRLSTNILPSGPPKLEEYRKAIDHILNRLRKRKKPRRAFQELGQDERESVTFDIDDTIELVIQLRDVLLICQKQGWSLRASTRNEASYVESPISSRPSSPGINSRSGSPESPEDRNIINMATLNRANQSKDSLEKILVLLEDLIQCDCRARISPRLYRPPGTLHSIVLDLAILLVQQNPTTPSWLYEIGMAVFPAFDVFPQGNLMGKLTGFFIDWIIPSLVACKNLIPETRGRELSRRGESSYFLEDQDYRGSQFTQIRVDPPDEPSNPDKGLYDRLSEDTRPRNLLPPSPSFSPRRSSNISITHNGDLDMTSYYTYSLVAPLVLSLVQHVHPYVTLRSQGSSVQPSTILKSPTHLTSMKTFHRALQSIIKIKADVYLDILDIISYGDQEVRFKAVQILFHYWGRSLGHLIVGEPLPLLSYEAEIKELEHRDLEAQQRVEMTARRSQHPTPDSSTASDRHIWFPHMFPDVDKRQSEDVGMMMKRSSTAMATMREDYAGSYCRECFKTVNGFGLRCYGCRENIHYNCYHNKSDEEHLMLFIKDSGVQKVVSPQFCEIPSNHKDELFRDPIDLNSPPSQIKKVELNIVGHCFRLINLFTLALCMSCRRPLWGIVYQGYRCIHCARFVHRECLDTIAEDIMNNCQLRGLTKADTAIDFSTFRKDFLTFWSDLIISIDKLGDFEYEELATMLNVLKLQDNILHCGVSAGCLLVGRGSVDPLLMHTNETFAMELQSSIEIYQRFLENGRAKGSSFLGDFWGDREAHNLDPCLFGEEEYLAHLAAMMKSSINSKIQGSITKRQSMGDSKSHLLVVGKPDLNSTLEDDDLRAPQEIMTLEDMMAWCSNSLGLRRHRSIFLLLQHMLNLGLFERVDTYPILMANSSAPKSDVKFLLPVPFAIDSSPSVESLISAISSCLADINISTNECGMVLLTRRCWPDSMLSRYVLERLFQNILGWVYAEDDQLLTIHTEYTTRNTRLPGVRARWAAATAAVTFINMAKKRMSASAAAGGSAQGGGVYVDNRRALKDKYLMGWMAAIHNMDRALFCEIIYDMTARIVEDKGEDGVINWEDDEQRKRMEVIKYEYFLSCILKLRSYGLVFSVFDDIISRWLDETYIKLSHDIGLDGSYQKYFNRFQPSILVELKSLQRVFSTSKASSRYSLPAEGQNLNVDTADGGDPLKSISRLAQEGGIDGVIRALRWIEMIQKGGVVIPPTIFFDLSGHLNSTGGSIEHYVLFLRILWYQVINGLGALTPRSAVASIVNEITEKNMNIIQQINSDDTMNSASSLKNAELFIELSMALALYAYNCQLSDISRLNIVPHFTDRVPTAPKRFSTALDPTPPMDITSDTPSISFFLDCLMLTRINVRGELIKGFWALFEWGAGINNKTEFTTSCLAKLTYSIWEVLKPSFDYLSDITIPLMMHAIIADPHYFHDCVNKIFDDDRWEVRYEGLDHLFGLFSKMDSVFQTKWLTNLASLGPVFSRFVSCLWDQEEYVRQKASSYIRVLQTTHLQSAFKCWDAYFMATSWEQRGQLCKLMIQFNAMFPIWQVIDWESLLEMFTTLDNVKEDEVSTAGILDLYMRPQSGISIDGMDIAAPADESEVDSLEHSRNVRVLMLTLALQMLGNGMDITNGQLFRLKYMLLKSMGFDNCVLKRIGTQRFELSFGDLSIQTDDFWTISVLMAGVRGMKRALDNFTPLKEETVASMGPEVTDETRKLNENNIGSIFVDIVLKMFNSGVDLTSLDHFMLRSWLELILTIIYKHDIQNKRWENDIVNCLKQIAELLTKDISEENKLLIMEIFMNLLKRSDSLAAMVLSRQIMAMGKAMTKLKSDSSNPVFLKSKAFLNQAFMKFAMAGLFILVFKNQAVSDENNQLEVDLFFVLRTVIDVADVIIDEGNPSKKIYLRDMPVMDVVDKLLTSSMDRRPFSTVLFNLNRYVELVHSHPYSEESLIEFGNFLSRLTKFTADWKRTDWDIDPVLSMAAVLLKEHPNDAKVLVPHMRILLRHAIQRCNITTESIVKLLAAYASVATVLNLNDGNAFAEIVIEELKQALRGRASTKISRENFMTMLQLILWDSQPSFAFWFKSIEEKMRATNIKNDTKRIAYFPTFADDLFEDVMTFVESPPMGRQYSKKEFKVSICASQLLVTMCLKQEDLLTKLMSISKSSDPRRTLRILNWFFIALSRSDATRLINKAFDMQDTVSDFIAQTIYSTTIDYNTPDINFRYSPTGELLLQIFLLIKTWTILYMKAISSQNELKSAGGVKINRKLAASLVAAERKFWNVVWPAIRRVLMNAEVGQGITEIQFGSIGIALWEFFFDVIQFLQICRSDIVMIYSQEWCTLLETILTGTLPAEFAENIRIIRDMFDIPPANLSEDTLTSQLLLELREAMRVQAEVHATRDMRFFAPLGGGVLID